MGGGFMGISGRVEEIRAVEHRKLRIALARAWTALRDLERARISVARTAPETDLWGDPIATDEVEVPASQVNLRPLFDAWSPFEESLLARLDRWEEDLWPLVRRWDAGESVDEDVILMAAELLSARSQVESHLRKVRNEASFVRELRAPMLSLFSAIEMCDRAEEGEAIPALLSGSRESANHAPRRRTPDDVTRALRMQLPSMDSDPYLDGAQARATPLSRFWSWLSGD